MFHYLFLFTISLDGAGTTSWGDRSTDGLSEDDEEVIKLWPVFLWKDGFERVFGFLWCFRLNPSQSVWDAMTMGIDGKVVISVESIDHDDVCSFSSYAF